MLARGERLTEVDLGYVLVGGDVLGAVEDALVPVRGQLDDHKVFVERGVLHVEPAARTVRLEGDGGADAVAEEVFTGGFLIPGRAGRGARLGGGVEPLHPEGAFDFAGRAVQVAQEEEKPQRDEDGAEDGEHQHKRGMGTGTLSQHKQSPRKNPRRAGKNQARQVILRRIFGRNQPR